jgi:uncharacterized membrane protein
MFFIDRSRALYTKFIMPSIFSNSQIPPKKLSTSRKELNSKWIEFLLIIILCLGIIFRFTNIDRKVYWIDEVHTSLRSSGYSRTEFVDLAPQNRLISVKDLQKFQQLHPDRNLWMGIKALASSEHSPLYYFLARLGMEAWGSSVFVTRIVAVIISLLAFPLVYWLAIELFADRLTGWIAVALLAISPFHLLYAQEAREYSLLTVTILLCCLTFLKAFKNNNKTSWLLYSLSLALSLYAHSLAISVAIGHGIYLFLDRDAGANPHELTSNKLKFNYGISSLLGILLFSPWIAVLIFNDDGVGQWTERHIAFGVWLQRYLLNLSSIFFDLQASYPERLFDVETGLDPGLNWTNPITYLIIPLVGLIIYSCYYLRNTSKSNSLFIWCLIAATAVTLSLPDLLISGQRSTVGRYITAVYLGIELAVAYCLSMNIRSSGYKNLWKLITAGLIILGVWCCGSIVQADTWWNKYSSYYNPQVAEIIDRSSKPLVITSIEKISRLTSLSYALQDKTKFILFPEETTSIDLPSGFSDIYLFRPDDKLVEAIKSDPRYQIEEIYPTGHLWQVK